MSLSNTPSAERTHIAFFGCTNSGKSSLVNAITNQNLSIVSEEKGTTTDAVKKTMELLPIGPVVIIDTAGIDDESKLGKKRIEKTYDVLNQTNIAILVVDSTVDIQKCDKELLKQFETKKIPYIIVYNKCDLLKTKKVKQNSQNIVYVSALTGVNIVEFKELLGKIVNDNKKEQYIVADILSQGDVVVLVTPIDESAPKGRLILPQQLVLRELLDFHCVPVCCQVEELDGVLKRFSSPRLVITDSQAFEKVAQIVPKTIKLTSFSILMARYKGELNNLVVGVRKIYELHDRDKVLISEGCTHHRQCNDIGNVKLPKWIEKFTHVKPDFEFTSGGEFPKDLTKYSLVIHCGGCMLNEVEMKNRVQRAKEQKVSIINYGITIAYLNGVLDRSLEIFK